MSIAIYKVFYEISTNMVSSQRPPSIHLISWEKSLAPKVLKSSSNNMPQE